MYTDVSPQKGSELLGHNDADDELIPMALHTQICNALEDQHRLDVEAKDAELNLWRTRIVSAAQSTELPPGALAPKDGEENVPSVDAITSWLDSLGPASDVAMQDHALHKVELQRAREECRYIQTQMALKEREIDKYRQQLEDQHATAVALRLENEELTTKAKQAEQSPSDEQAEKIAELEQQLAEKDRTIDRLRKQIEVVSDRLDDDGAVALGAKAIQMFHDHQQRKEEVKKLKVQREEAEADRNEAQRREGELRSVVDQQRTELRELHSQVEAERMGKMQAMDRLRDETDRSAAKISELTQRDRDARRRIGGMEAQLAGLDEALQRAQSEVASKTAAIQRLETELTRAKGEAKSQAEGWEAAQLSVEELEAQLGDAVTSKEQAIEARDNALQEKTRLERQRDASRAEAAVLHRRLEELDRHYKAQLAQQERVHGDEADLLKQQIMASERALNGIRAQLGAVPSGSQLLETPRATAPMSPRRQWGRPVPSVPRVEGQAAPRELPSPGRVRQPSPPKNDVTAQTAFDASYYDDELEGVNGAPYIPDTNSELDCAVAAMLNKPAYRAVRSLVIRMPNHPGMYYFMTSQVRLLLRGERLFVQGVGSGGQDVSFEEYAQRFMDSA